MIGDDFTNMSLRLYISHTMSLNFALIWSTGLIRVLSMMNKRMHRIGRLRNTEYEEHISMLKMMKYDVELRDVIELCDKKFKNALHTNHKPFGDLNFRFH